MEYLLQLLVHLGDSSKKTKLFFSGSWINLCPSVVMLLSLTSTLSYKTLPWESILTKHAKPIPCYHLCQSQIHNTEKWHLQPGHWPWPLQLSPLVSGILTVIHQVLTLCHHEATPTMHTPLCLQINWVHLVCTHTCPADLQPSCHCCYGQPSLLHHPHQCFWALPLMQQSDGLTLHQH